jgi:predicted negative regulator of RcsB-dependent stress response
MAKHLDLEEQEQLAELKHFWKRYGNVISWVLIAVFGAVAAWNGYQYWQRNQSSQAAVMYDEVERAAVAGDVPKLERVMTDMKDRYAGTAYAEQAALLAARIYQDKGNLDAAKGALAWVAGKGKDAGYQSVARLRLSGMLLESRAYDEALQQLAAPMPKDFAPLAADRSGDILLAQGKKAEAKAQYQSAYKALDERSDYRRIIEIKLNALGVDPVIKPAIPASSSKEAGQ